jgi:very-short-patch-repair endonuclease
VAAAVAQLGGITTRSELLRRVVARDLAQALASGEVRRAGRGRYALPTDIAARAAAEEVHGAAILLSAAAHWKWRRKWDPQRPQIAVKRGRRVGADLRESFDVRWRSIPASGLVDGWVTTPARTVLDCAVLLPFDEALAVADSAYRSGSVDRAELLARLPQLDAQLRPRVRRVAEAADAFTANPFESVLRAIALEVPGLHLVPQVRIDDVDGWVGRVDLADRRLRIVLEAESFEFHGERQVLDRDCARYTRLVADGWLVLRFSWEQVMTRPDWVRSMIARAVALRAASAA